MRALILASFVTFGVAVAACSATNPNQFNPTGTGGTGAGSGMGGDINLGAGFGTGGSTPSDGCSDAAKLVYVLSTGGDIWSFEPATKAFTFVATLDCVGNNSPFGPNSMAIDRNAVAWINYATSDDSQGLVFKFDLIKKTCDKTPAATLVQGWTRLGMGFSTDSATGTDEKLYINGTGANAQGLGRLDTTTGQVIPIGPFTGAVAGNSAELTGTGDAKLYGFFTFLGAFPPLPVHVAEINKATGATPAGTDVTLANVPSPNDWAFSFWGGEFYLYTSDGATNSNVVHFDPVTKQADPSYVPDVGFIIVGAGVSTCAPIAPPK
jgi:hypothetical protein